MVRKILTTAIALAFLAGLGILGYCIVSKWYDKKYGKYSDWKLTNCLTAVKYNNDEIGVRNDSTGKILDRYDDIRPSYHNSLNATVLIVIKNNLRGYISAKTGEVLFEPQFLYAWLDDPESGLATCVSKDHKLGFVNVRTKEIAIPFQFDFDEDKFVPYDYPNTRFGERIPILDFVFSNGICIIPGKDGKIGMIDKTGKVLLPARYLDIINWRDANTPNIILKKNTAENSGYNYVYGVCDRNFKVLVPFEYNSFEKNWKYADDTDDEGYNNILMQNYIVSKDGKYGILDTLFNEILPLKYGQIEVKDNSYLVEYEGKYGVLDSHFKTVLPIEYDWINAIHIGGDYDHYKYIAKKNYVQKLYDEKGKIIHNFYIEDTYNTFETIYDEKGTLTPYIRYHLDGLYGIIDGDNRVVIPAKYDKIEYLGNGNFVCTKDEYSFLIKDKK